MIELAEAVVKLHEARQAAQTASEHVKELEAAFREEHKEAFDALEAARQAATDAELRVRAVAAAVYAETGEKNVGYGVKTAIAKKLDVDEEAALKAAVERKLLAALNLNKRAYSQLRKAEPSLPGEFKETVTVCIPRDLASVFDAARGTLDAALDALAGEADAQRAGDAFGQYGYDGDA